MKRFIYHFCIIIIGSVFALEVLLRLFNLAGHTIPEANIDDSRLYQPNADSVWVKGGFGEIKAHYHINNLGWNSTIDYSFDSNNLSKMALIGDSYVEGFHHPVEKSIGRQFEEIQGDSTVVYEFGKSSGNIIDCGLIYQKYNLSEFQQVFILISNGDLMATKAEIMNTKPKILGKGYSRQIYNHSNLIRYLNINHGLSIHLKNVPKKIFRNRKNQSLAQTHQPDLSKFNLESLKSFGENVVFLFEEDNLSPEVKSLITFPIQKIDQIFTPNTHGFDYHWNANGRKNCAVAMIKYLDDNKK